MAKTEKTQDTESMNWKLNKEPDPMGTRYNCLRKDLTMGEMTDDQLAGELFIHGNARPDFGAIVAGSARMPIVYLEAGKDRIRWLARQNAEKEERLNKLLSVCEDLKRDLLERAEIASDGCKVVDVSSTIWEQFKCELGK